MKAQRICEEIIQLLVADGFRRQVSRKNLEDAIRVKRDCVDERTIQRWIKALEAFKFIKMKAPDVYELNPMGIPELIKLLKENSQTKIL